MSIRYEDKLVGVTWNYIKDNDSTVNSTYSSEKTQLLASEVQDENDRLIALTKGVRDVVHTHDELLNYPTDTLIVGDVINVLKDEAHEDGSTYYSWDGQLPFVYIGEIPPYYTKLETDTKLDGKQDILVDGENIKTINGQSLLGTGDLTFDPNNLKWFPVGTIYPAYNDIDPNDFIGGTWEKLTDRFLRQADSIYYVGNTGGEETVALDRNGYLPKHTHVGRTHSHGITTDSFKRNASASLSSGSNFAVPAIRGLERNNGSPSGYNILVMKRSSGGVWNQPGNSQWNVLYSNGDTAHGEFFMNYSRPSMQNTGGDQPHTNMHRYLAVNYWVRTA